MKKFIAILSLLALAACGGGGGGGMSVTTSGLLNTGSVTVSGPTINGSGTGSILIEITNADEIKNNINTGDLNGKTSIDVDTKVEVKLDVNTDNGNINIHEKEINTTNLTAYEVANSNSYKDYDVSSAGSITIDGHTISYSARESYNTTSIPKLGKDFEVVDGSTGYNTTNYDFFITNTATGTPDFTNYEITDYDYGVLNEKSNSGVFGDRIKAVHGQGWTGKGSTIVNQTGGSSWYTKAVIAPGAKDGGLSDSYARVTLKDNTKITRSTSNSNYNNAYVGVSALVSHKFDTLTGAQVVDVIENTKDGNTINPVKAISPVGNVN